MRALKQQILLFNVCCALNAENERKGVTTWKCIEIDLLSVPWFFLSTTRSGAADFLFIINITVSDSPQQ